jgi:outer membrane protein assembly factor BamB
MTNGVGSGNRLVAYNKTTGEEVWRADTVFYSWGSPVDCYDAEGNAYIISGDVGGRIHLFNASTGEELYYMDTLRSKGTANESAGGNMEASVIIIDNMIIIGTRGGSVFGVKIK